MKIIHTINKWSFIITLVLYLTIYLGLYSQILLGGIQLLIALILLFQWKNFSLKQQKLLQRYWTIVFIYVLLILSIIQIDFNENWWLWILGLTIVPMCIAAYFVYLTNKLKTTIDNPIKQ